MVARERRKPIDEIQMLATGEFWGGKRALELGLIDALGDRETALEDLGRMTSVPVRKTVRVAPPRPFFERMFSGGLASMPGLATGIRDALEDTLLDLGPFGPR